MRTEGDKRMFHDIGTVNHVNFLEIVRHPWFMSAAIAGVSANVIKMLVARVRRGIWDWRELKAAGGMPSAHSALVSSLAFAVGLTDGFDKPYAMIAAGFALIVLIDAATLRRESGEHAKLLNKIISHLNSASESDRIEAQRLEERLGHRRREVLAGVFWGCLVAFSVCAVWDFWK